jgi:hypothetical protein
MCYIAPVLMPYALSRAIALGPDDLLNGSRCSVELCEFLCATDIGVHRRARSC